MDRIGIRKMLNGIQSAGDPERVNGRLSRMSADFAQHAMKFAASGVLGAGADASALRLLASHSGAHPAMHTS